MRTDKRKTREEEVVQGEEEGRKKGRKDSQGVEMEENGVGERERRRGTLWKGNEGREEKEDGKVCKKARLR